MKKITLTKGKVALIDDDMYDSLSQINWCIDSTGYAFNTKYRRIHTLILPVEKPFFVDHIDRNKLNNQRSNLRICTKQQNAWNVSKKSCTGTSKFKGVHWDKSRNKWMARIRIKGITKNLGRFESETIAAKFYDDAAKLHYKEFAYLNL